MNYSWLQNISCGRAAPKVELNLSETGQRTNLFGVKHWLIWKFKLNENKSTVEKAHFKKLKGNFKMQAMIRV